MRFMTADRNKAEIFIPQIKAVNPLLYSCMAYACKNLFGHQLSFNCRLLFNAGFHRLTVRFDVCAVCRVVKIILYKTAIGNKILPSGWMKGNRKTVIIFQPAYVSVDFIGIEVLSAQIAGIFSVPDSYASGYISGLTYSSP